MSALSSAFVATKFKHLLEQIQPQPTVMARATAHCVQVHTRLLKTFDVKRATRIGSHWKGTAIRGYSDVDYLVVMTRDEARKWARDSNSSTLVNRIRADLQARFTSTSVRRDGQAVVVNFEQGQLAVDVVPAIFGSFATAPRYHIPSGDGGWIETSPEGQRKLLLINNAKSGAKLIPLIRLLKWWARSRDATLPLSSYYLETFLLGLTIPVAIPYSRAVADALMLLDKRRCAGAQDPLSLSRNLIAAVATTNQLSAVLAILAPAAARARDAVAAEAAGNHLEALRLWSIVFNHEFPD